MSTLGGAAEWPSVLILSGLESLIEKEDEEEEDVGEGGEAEAFRYASEERLTRILALLRETCSGWADTRDKKVRILVGYSPQNEMVPVGQVHRLQIFSDEIWTLERLMREKKDKEEEVIRLRMSSCSLGMTTVCRMNFKLCARAKQYFAETLVEER